MATKTTKRALLLSVVSLFICFTMLLGTTYAWFTDSVTSTGNIIKTGTLDVTLEYKTPTDTNWQDASRGAIFKYTNWEPGYTEVRYVKIENKGSLALKFMLNIIPNEQLAAGAADLADVIDVYMITGEQPVSRTDLDAITPVGTLADLIAEDDGAAHGILQPAEKEVYTIVLKMQETAGNEYQNLSVGGGFAVQLLATQLANEDDDLGTEYDTEATYPDVVIETAKKEEGKSAQVATKDENNNDEVVVDIPVNAPAGDYSLEVTDKQVITDANGNTTVYMDITLKKDGAKVTVDPNGNILYTVSVNIGAGIGFNKLVHAGTPITDYEYDIVTGIVTFTTDSFSPFEFGYDEVGVKVENVESIESIKDIFANGGLITLTEDIELTDVLLISKSTVINGNGYKIISGANRVIRVTASDINVVLNDVNMVSDYAASYVADGRGINIDASLKNVVLTLNNCSVDFTKSNDWAYGVNVSGSGSGHKVTVNGGSYEGANVINAHGANNTIIVKNATLTSVYPKYDKYYGACIWVLKKQGSRVEAYGNTYAGECAIAYNLGSGTELVEENNVDNTGVIAVATNEGGYQTFAEAIEKAKGYEIIVLRDVSESFDAIENVTLISGVEGGVTITNTFAEDKWIAFNNVKIMSGVTLIMPNVLINGANEGGSTNVIEGVLMAGTVTNTTTYYQYNDAKTTVQNGGQIIVSGDTVLRYNYNEDSGIFIYGDGDDSTVEYSSGLYSGGYIGAYSGTFYAKDAVVNTGDLRLDFKKGSNEEPDKYAPINAEFVNSKVSVTSELRFYNDARMTLTNSQVTVGKAQVREAATPVITMDENSFIKATTVENVTGAFVQAVLGEDGKVSFVSMAAQVGTQAYSDLASAIAAATNGSTVTLLKNIDADFGIVIPEGVTLDGNGFSITYCGTEYTYHLVKLSTNATLKNVVLNNYRVRTEEATQTKVTLKNVTINMDNDGTGLDISRGSGVAVLENVVCKGIKDAVHLDPSTEIQVDYTPYGDVLLGTKWGLEATDCNFGSLHGWNTTNGSNVYLNNTTYTVFRMHYWSNRTLYVNGVETAWTESGAIPVVHDTYGCWKVIPFK